jgi:ribosome-associated heat shock protein Hsp15
VRADVYLWAVRLFKTRATAAEALRSGQVSIGGTEIKASRDVKSGEVLVLRFTGYTRSFEILGLPRTRVGAALVQNLMREVTSPEEVEKRELLDLSRKLQRNQGLGRPTKRDRRDLEDWI